MGYMASGKTTFGRALARKLGVRHIDLDFYIEQRFRKTIPEIFESEGENAFRAKESAMLREVGEFEDVVISCGGGTPCFGDNMDYMLQCGLTVFLDTSEECMVRRLVANNRRRPLMAGKTEAEISSKLREVMELRRPYYQKAEFTMSGDKLEDCGQIEESVTRFLSEVVMSS